MANVTEIKIDNNILESIKKIAKRENTSEEAIINESLRKMIEEEEYDCEAFEKAIKEARAEPGIEISVEELAKEFGVDLD